MARSYVSNDGPGLPDNAFLEAQQRAKLKIKDCLPSIIEKLSATEKCSLIFLSLDKSNLVNTGHTLCQYSYAGRDISDYVWRGSSGNVDALLSSLFHICRFDLLESPLGLCVSHSMEQVCLSAGGVEHDRLALYKVFAALPQVAADTLLSQHLSQWRSVGRCLEETFCRNLTPNNFATLISELHFALTASSQARLASCLAPHLPREASSPSSGGGCGGDVYALPTSTPYGLCVIINVNSFVEPLAASEEVALPSRRGSDIDVMRLEGTFALFGFEVIKLTDPDAVQIENLFANMRRDVRLASIACLVVCIMTHGDSDDNLFLHDRRSIALHDLRRLCFTPFLINKPRLFFVQACRGDRVLQPMFVRHDSGGAAQAVNRESDCLICCATVQGYPAMRSQSSGSWFISDLCSALQQSGHVSPIMRVLQAARRSLNTRVDMLGAHFVMQAGEDTTTLLKDVQLLRGPESQFSGGCVLLTLLELLEELIEEAVERYCESLPSDSFEMMNIVRRLQQEEAYVSSAH